MPTTAKHSPLESKAGFWTTLPGILTGAAGMLTALGAILAIVLHHDPTPSPSPKTASEQGRFVADANRICRQINAEDLQLYDSADAPSARVNELRAFVAAQLDMNHRIQALPAPAADQDQVSSMLIDWQQVANDINAAANAATQGSYSSEAAWVSQADGPNNQGNDLADALGLGNCASAQL